MNKVKAYRSLLNLSQADMAKILHLNSRQAYSSKENGIRQFSVNEMLLFKEEIKKKIPDITIDEIFFDLDATQMIHKKNK